MFVGWMMLWGPYVAGRALPAWWLADILTLVGMVGAAWAAVGALQGRNAVRAWRRLLGLVSLIVLPGIVVRLLERVTEAIMLGRAVPITAGLRWGVSRFAMGTLAIALGAMVWWAVERRIRRVREQELRATAPRILR